MGVVVVAMFFGIEEYEKGTGYWKAFFKGKEALDQFTDGA